MPPIRAEHGLSWRKGNSTHTVGQAAATSGGVDGEERAKQARRNIGVPRRHSPSHSRTPSPNHLQVPSACGMAVHVAAHGHIFGHGARRSPASKAAGSAGSSVRGGGAAFADGVGGPSSREKRRASPDPSRKGYAHAHTSQRSLGSKSPAFGPPLKGPSARVSAGGGSWGVSSPTPGMGGGVGSGRAICSPTPLSASSGRARGDATDVQFVAPQLQGGHSGLSSQQHGVFLPLPSTSTGLGSMAGVGSGASSAPRAVQQAEAREMTVLDRVFLQQSHMGREDVGDDDDLHVANDEIQRHLQQTVQSQLIEATNRNASAGSGSCIGLSTGGAGGGRGSAGGSLSSGRSRASNQFVAGAHQALGQGLSGSPAFVGQEMELISDDRDYYSPDPIRDNPASDPVKNGFASAVPHQRRGGGGGSGESAQAPSSGAALNGYASPVSISIGTTNDLLDDPDNMGSAGVPPVSPSSGGGPAQGLVLDVGSSVEFLPQGGARNARVAPSGVGSQSSLGAGLTPDVPTGEASGDGQLREVVSGLDAMDLDDVDRALALLTAQKERIIAKQHAGAAAAAAAHAEAQAVTILVPPQPPPLQSSNGTGTSNAGSTTLGSRTGGGGRQRRSGARSRHGGEGSSPSAGGRSEAFGGSGGGVRGGAPVSFSRTPRGQGRPPPVPGHLSASTAAMRRSSPGNIASLAELDSYLEYHHRRLVEQVNHGCFLGGRVLNSNLEYIIGEVWGGLCCCAVGFNACIEETLEVCTQILPNLSCGFSSAFLCLARVATSLAYTVAVSYACS